MTQKTEKFRIKVPGPGPNGVRRAYEIHIKTPTDLWAKEGTDMRLRGPDGSPFICNVRKCCVP